jgi:hypothetical protein
MAKSPEELAHIEWLGYVQPVGLVVSIPAMLESQCYVNKNIMAEHAKFLNCLVRDSAGNLQFEIRDLREFVQAVLGWESNDLITLPAKGPLPSEHSNLEVILPQYNETLRPTHIVPEFSSNTTHQPLPPNPYPLTTNHYLLLIQELASKTDFDEPLESDSAKHWNASPQAKFERLLRETGVPIGLLFNRSQFRLVYAPRGETSGYATFNVDEMAQVAGRPMFAALHMLLGVERLFSLADKQRLPYILENSRKYQNTVSTALAEQVTSALFELLRGFQAANDQRVGELLRHVLANNPQHVYHGLLTVLMRLVFVLYAEDRGLVSSDPTYTNHYSVSGLFERLRSEAGRFPDTMDQRFGAWAQLLTLFRLVYEGGQHAELKIPPRKGYLFDPRRYPFLEGRFDDGKAEVSSVEEQSSAIQIPHISDGVIYRVLEDLLILDGERLSYRTLDVEQIGSVYEAIMGFELQVSAGKSIAIKPVKSHGAPATINLEALLAAKPADRAKLLNEWTDQKLGAGDAAAIKDATSIDELVAALDKKVAKHVTPGIVPADSMVFQPSDERRRSGSHYTPRSLTQPIVRITLEPILKQMYDPEFPLPKVYEPTREDKLRYTVGELEARVRLSKKHIAATEAARAVGCAHPWQILELKVCDPAMGSGAFLVETCRQLGDELIKAWYAHDMIPADIPPDEDEVLYARRTVAQRCLYGVDKNIMAVDLAKLSLWLVTLAKDHPFTFLDHALRHGDSLVGLTREQIIRFHWSSMQQRLAADAIQRRLDRATEARAKILNAREDVAYRDQEQRMAVADEALNLIRLIGDACVSCFFVEEKNKAREEELDRVFAFASSYLSSLPDHKPKPTGPIDFNSRAALQTAADRLNVRPHSLRCFHWEIEFPEVFGRERGGFDCFLGNPPFLGGRRISTVNGGAYLAYLLAANINAGNLCDLVAYFFRRCFQLLRLEGVLGLLGTKTIAEGDTRIGGLEWILDHDGYIYSARRRVQWPGIASVVVSVVHISKGRRPSISVLDSKQVSKITSYLFSRGSNHAPARFESRSNLWSKGSQIYGQGFLFDDGDPAATSTDVMRSILDSEPGLHERIIPYIGGKEINSLADLNPARWAIYLSDLSTEEEVCRYPSLEKIVREKVKPERDNLPDKPSNRPLKKKWWAYQAHRPSLYLQMKSMSRVLVGSQVTAHIAFAFQPTDRIFSQKLNVFLLDDWASFAILQSTIHEVFVRTFSSTLGETLNYSASDCFETFCFPSMEDCDELDKVGEEYYLIRADAMMRLGEGLTKIYNRFHSPHENDQGILELRELHNELDAKVLSAYGWSDLLKRVSQSGFRQFVPTGTEDDENLESAGLRQKSSWEYRWSDELREEVLAHLLELNEQRHKEELLLVKSNSSEAKSKKEPSKKPAKATPLLDCLDQVELDRGERLILLIVDSFKLITRTAVDEAFIAMKYPKLRKSRLGLGDPPKSVPRTDAGRDALIGGLLDRGFLEKHPSDHQQVWKLGSTAPLLAATKAERQALEETKAIFEKSIGANDDLASFKEGVTDAKPGLVSIA